MVRTVLRIVLHDEERCVLPDRAFADEIHQLPNTVVVVGNFSLRSELSYPQTLSVVVHYAQRDERRNGVAGWILSEHLLELAHELGDAAGHVVVTIRCFAVGATISGWSVAIGIGSVIATEIIVADAA